MTGKDVRPNHNPGDSYGLGLDLALKPAREDGTVTTKGTRQQGFTLVEILVVIALIGALVYIGINSMTGIYQRMKLQSSARDVSAFLQKAYVEMRDRHQPVFIRFDTTQRLLMVTTDRDTLNVTTIIGRMPLDSCLTLKTGATYFNWPKDPGDSTEAVLEIDTMGRLLNPYTNAMVTNTQVVTFTHDLMEKGRLAPKTQYRLRIYPLYKVSMDKVIV